MDDEMKGKNLDFYTMYKDEVTSHIVIKDFKLVLSEVYKRIFKTAIYENSNNKRYGVCVYEDEMFPI